MADKSADWIVVNDVGEGRRLRPTTTRSCSFPRRDSASSFQRPKKEVADKTGTRYPRRCRGGDPQKI
jgi:hypothetical protein